MSALAIKIDGTPVTVGYVKERLEQAGYALQCLPGDGPQEYGSNWPDIPRTSVETWILQLQAEQDVEVKRVMSEEVNRVRLHATREQIAALDDYLKWRAWLPDNKTKKVVAMRMFRHPVGERYLYSWPRVAKEIGYGVRWARELHERALQIISDNARKIAA